MLFHAFLVVPAVLMLFTFEATSLPDDETCFRFLDSLANASKENRAQSDSAIQQLKDSDRLLQEKLAAIEEQVENLGKKVNETAKECEKSCKVPDTNCYDLEHSGVNTNGVYKITVGRKITEVYCDMETDGGGWTVIQRRTSNAVDFYKDWNSYKVGFGDVSDNYWLGLETIHEMTSSQSYQLRVDLEEFSGNRVYALYSSFSVGSESSNYQLHISGYSGNAGNSLSRDQAFTTKDRDNDAWGSGNCAVTWHGAWWYNNCGYANLNGKYYSSRVIAGNGVTWTIPEWNGVSMKRAEMKIKPN